MVKKAWVLERELRDNAIPLDRRLHESNWYEAGFEVPTGDALNALFWESKVPGSSAPEIAYLSMAQSLDNQGYDVTEAETLIPECLELHKAGKKDELRVLTAKFLHLLNTAPRISSHPYNDFDHPNTWETTRAAMPAMHNRYMKTAWQEKYQDQIYQGWLGQLAGGSFGTAIEGYTGEQISKLYGDVRGYITQPETTNDDVVYELLLLDVFERMGNSITAEALSMEWVRQVTFGWSAEWVALRNLNMGIFPPASGSFMNPYSDWIGAQMRGMVCGMLAPANPMQAAWLAHLDGQVSHSRNGIYGEMYAAVLTALAFEMDDIRQLVLKAAEYIPANSEYAAKLRFTFDTLQKNSSKENALKDLNKHFEQYNWIHAYPNIADDLFALWYGNGDFTETMSLLAQGGNDVDCNAGLVGNVLGVMFGVPAVWSEPIGDLLETYIIGKEKLSIRELAHRTARLARLNL